MPHNVVCVFQENFSSAPTDFLFYTEYYSVPTLTLLTQGLTNYDPLEGVAIARAIKVQLAKALEDQCWPLYQSLKPQANDRSLLACGQRAFKGLCLEYLCLTEKNLYRKEALNEVLKGDHKTTTDAAMRTLLHTNDENRTEALSHFYNTWCDDAIVINDYLTYVSGSYLETTLESVQSIEKLPIFSMTSPNNVRSLIASFARNSYAFHSPAQDFSGYKYLADKVLQIDALNAQTAARVASFFDLWNRLKSPYKEAMKAQIDRLVGTPGLSNNSYEILSNAQKYS